MLVWIVICNNYVYEGYSTPDSIWSNIVDANKRAEELRKEKMNGDVVEILEYKLDTIEE